MPALRAAFRRMYVSPAAAGAFFALFFGASALLSTYEPSDVPGALTALLAGIGLFSAGVALGLGRVRMDARTLAALAGALAVAVWPFGEYVYGKFVEGGLLLRAFELGSVGAFFVCSAAFFAAYVFGRRYGASALGETIFFLGGVGAFLFLCGVVSPARAFLGIFGDSFSAQLLFAVALLYRLAIPSPAPRSPWYRYASGALLLALVGALVCSGSAGLMLSVAAAAGLTAYLMKQVRRHAIFSFAVALGFILVAVLDLSGLLPLEFAVSHSPGVRATHAASAFIMASESARHARPASVFLGGGPGSFEAEWVLTPVSTLFPASSSTPPFVRGSDSFSSIAIDFGIPFAFFLFACLAYAVGSIGETSTHCDAGTHLGLLSPLVLGLLWCGLYVPSIVYLTLLFALLGVALAEHDHGIAIPPTALRRSRRTFVVVIGGLLAIFGVYLAYRGAVRVATLVPYERGMHELQLSTPQLFTAENYFRKSISYESTFFNESALAEADDAEIQLLVPKAVDGTLSSQESLRLAALSVEVFPAAETAYGKHVFASHLLLRARAKIDTGVLLHDSKKITSALTDLAMVEAAAPRDPTAYLLEARVRNALGDEDGARHALRIGLGLMGAVIY